MIGEFQEWYFTFGYGHSHGPNGYTKIYGTFVSARQEMFRRYGPKWSFQYDSIKGAKLVNDYNLIEV